MLHKLAKIKDLPELTPDREWFSVNKAHILAEISARNREREASRLTFMERLDLITLKITRRLVPSSVKVVSFGLLFAFVFSTNFIAQAAVPGEFLWPVKISFEKAELAFVTDPVVEAEISLKHANKRLKELEVIASRDTDIDYKQKVISQIMRQLEKNMVSAQGSLKIAKSEQKNNVRTVNLARSVSKSAAQTTKALKDQAKSLTGVVIVDGTVISGQNTNLYQVEVTVTHDSGFDPEAEAKRGSTASENEVVEAITDAIKVNNEVAGGALDTVLKLSNEADLGTSAELQELISDKISSQETELSDVATVVEGIDTANVRSQVVNGEANKDVTLDDVATISTSPKSSADALEEAKKLLAEGSVDEALSKIAESDALLRETVLSLARIDAAPEPKPEPVQPGTVIVSPPKVKAQGGRSQIITGPTETSTEDGL